jgi:hypothetical protein
VSAPLLSRSLAMRAALVGAGLAAIAGSFASCILADPPPALPIIPPAAPMLHSDSAYPPPGIFTGWPLGGLTFVVQVQVLNPIEGVWYGMLQVEGTANSSLVPPTTALSPAGDGGLITLMVTPPAPSDSNCHTFTLVVDSYDDGMQNNGMWFPMVGGMGVPAALPCNPLLCTTIQWTYEPAGSAGTCPVFDAGVPPLQDAGPDSE